MNDQRCQRARSAGRLIVECLNAVAENANNRVDGHTVIGHLLPDDTDSRLVLKLERFDDLMWATL